jgi:hypothetical protein
MAIALRADRLGKFTVTGHLDGIFGAEPRHVRFGVGHVLAYIGTVMNSGDSHAKPTGRREFRLTIGDTGISFVAQ